jgi:two-component system, OmpR family, response regulator ResD
MKNKTILLIEDNPTFRHLLEDIYTEAGAQVVSAIDGDSGVRTFFKERPDIVILDIHLPKIDGWSVCAEIRRLADTPIIILTSANSEKEMLQGFDCGANDYITKPISPKLLLARTKAVLQHINSPTIQQEGLFYDDGYLRIDMSKREIRANQQPVPLTNTEYKMFTLFVRHNNHLLTYEQILEYVWGWDHSGNASNVHLIVSRMRQKLELDPKEPRYFLLVYGLGYRFRLSTSLH